MLVFSFEISRRCYVAERATIGRGPDEDEEAGLGWEALAALAAPAGLCACVCVPGCDAFAGAACFCQF
jgi:hypothetical protein